MPLSNSELAAEVFQLLRSAKLERNDEEIEKAADLARIEVPPLSSAATPRFEAYFAIATLGRALRNREEKTAIAERLQHALILTRRWIESTGRDSSAF